MSKLDDALAYLRSRNLYCLDKGSKFKWKSGADVAKTTGDEEKRKRAQQATQPSVIVQIRKGSK